MNAFGHLLEKYSLFYLPPHLDSYGFGPQVLQKDNLVVPVALTPGGYSAVDFKIAKDRKAISLQLYDANDFKEDHFMRTNPKAGL